MIKRDYYEVLEIERTADAVEIKRVYRKIALECHPDRCDGDKEKEKRFKEASEAYEVLSDSQKRQVYDAYGHHGLEGRGYHGFSGVDDIFSSFGSLFEDFFNFGMGGGRQRVSKGADAGFEMTIDFKEAMDGIEKKIDANRAVRCDECGGAGIPKDKVHDKCKSCGGSGRATVRQGFFVMQTTCPSCRGRGNTAICKECRGQGMVEKSRKLTVKIPAGVDDGMRLVLRGEGNMSPNGGPPGDLFVLIHVKSDKRF